MTRIRCSNRVRELIAMRKRHKALSAHARIRSCMRWGNEYPFIYARAADEEVILVVLNPSGQERRAEFTSNLRIAGRRLIAGDEISMGSAGSRISVTVPPVTYSIYIMQAGHDSQPVI